MDDKPSSTARKRERDLVARANAGDGRALETLYAEHRDWVTALAYRFTGSRDDALDVLQETFMYVYSKFPGFELTASLRGFLYPVVKHKSISVIRRRQKLVDLDMHREGRHGELLRWHPSDASGHQLAALVSELPPAQREVIWLRFGLEFRLEEIAVAMEIPLGTVKSRLHNALKSLRSAAEPTEQTKTGGQG